MSGDQIIDRRVTIANPKNVHKLGRLEQMVVEWDAWRFARTMDSARDVTVTWRSKGMQEMTRSTRPAVKRGLLLGNR